MLAYFDSFAGLVPCRLVAIGQGHARIVVTAPRGGRQTLLAAYKRGQVVDTTWRKVVPRNAVYRSRQACGQYRIRPYSWGAILFGQPAHAAV